MPAKVPTDVQQVDAKAGETPPCFRTEGLTKVYGTGHSAVYALRGVDLLLPERELVVLLGASGSGKSTLLNILGGLDRAMEGRHSSAATANGACSGWTAAAPF